MALYSNMRRPLYYYLSAIASNVPKHYNNIHDKVVTLEIDALDNFTSQLIQRKVDKWSIQKSGKQFMYKLESNNTKHDYSYIRELNIEKINNIFQDFIEAGDNDSVLYLTTECVKYRKCPSLSNLIYILSYCAQIGDKSTIKQVQNLCEEIHPEIITQNSNFDNYLAEAVWIKGNISESLYIFRRVYDENAYLRRRIRLTFKYLITNVVSNRSEAVLINIVKFCEDLVKCYKDFFPLTCIWEVCFLSEWYTDQCLALDLLDKNKGLMQTVVKRIPYVISISLNSHNTEVIYRLLEILLKYKMKPQYIEVLSALLNYQVYRGDIRRCMEIIQWSIKHDVELPTLHNENFLKLLVHYNIEVHKPHSIKKQKFDTDYKF